MLIGSTLIFSGNSTLNFIRNSGTKGGALALSELATLKFSMYDAFVSLNFIENYAENVGGALFVEDSDYLKRGYSDFSITFSIPVLPFPLIFRNGYVHNSCKPRQEAHFHFVGNTANQAGSSIYGGWINILQKQRSCNHFYFSNDSQNDLSVISSNPVRVCVCQKSRPNCSITNVVEELFPGQTYEMEAVAVGQLFGSVPSIVQAHILGQTQGTLDQNQYVQTVERECTKLTFTVRTSDERINISVNDSSRSIITTDNKLFDPMLYQQLILSFHMKNCSPGFYFDSNYMQCVCQQILLNNNIDCDYETWKVKRISPKWITSTSKHLTAEQSRYGIIVHDHCPYDYCVSGIVQQLDLLHPDEQCKYNRSGILCGECRKNFSHMLGTSRCKRCTASWIALIIPLIAIAGVVLVVGLMLLNITVSVGTINGLTFYANIFSTSQAIFTSHNTSQSFLGIFIAWLNLDLGFEVCFYDGLDAYAKTWMQFLFPIYIWFIVIIIILVTQNSIRASRIIGNNAVQVLATLFLLSYAKLLRIIITIFSSTELVYPDGFHKRVWYYDGNVDYLTGKHIPLFITALLLLIFISAPYTVILLFIQWLQKISHLKLLFWVVKLHPLFDAYTGPYKIKHRYWTGLLLLVRVCLFLFYSLNRLGDPTVNLLATSIVISCLFAYMSVIGGVYKMWWLNMIESSFLLNICLLSAATTYQIKDNSVDTTAVTFISTGITFVIFTAIIVYHLLVKIIPKSRLEQLLAKRLTRTVENKENSDQVKDEQTQITHSEIQLREPLLEL